MLLSLHQVNVVVHNRTKPHYLLQNIDFAIDSSDILSIVGPNGAGKSTLIKVLAGELSCTGEIQFSGFADSSPQRCKQIAVLPQHSSLNFPFTVKEVVALGRIPHASGRQQDDNIIKELLNLLDISDLAERPYTDLSGGEQQRTQLARVLAQIWQSDNPRLLLLDEPCAALDLGHQQQLMRLLQTLSSMGISIVMSQHDINLAARFSSKILALLNAEQIHFGSPHEVITADTIKQLYDIDVTIQPHPHAGTPQIVCL